MTKTIATISLVEKDGQLTLEFQSDSSETTNLANITDQFISALSQIRPQMDPAIPSDPPLDQRVVSIEDPRFWVTTNPMAGGAALLFRHPGLGWLTFAIPVNSLQRLSDLLNEQLQAAKSGPGLAH